MSVVTNYTTWNSLIDTANSATNGAWGGLMPFVVWAIIYAFSTPYGFASAFATASFLSFLTALPLFALGVTSGWVMVILMVLTLAGIIMVWRKPG